MPLGEYNKNNFLMRGLQRARVDEDEYGLPTKVLKRYVPQFTSTGIPYMKTEEDGGVSEHMGSKNDSVDEHIHEAIRDARDVASVANAVTSAPNWALKGYNTLRGAGLLEDSTKLYNALSRIQPAAEELGKLSNGLNVVGGALSAANLGNDIATAVRDKHVSFDNATGVASAAVSMIPAVGMPLSLAMQGGEKLVTGIIKGAKAVKDEKEKEGVKHLDPKTWLYTTFGANVPHWMLADISKSYREWKKKAPERKAERKRKKEEWKHMSGKEKAHRFFFG
jgi:hypothetical protein